MLVSPESGSKHVEPHEEAAILEDEPETRFFGEHF